jgi:hypothetical protein
LTDAINTSAARKLMEAAAIEKADRQQINNRNNQNIKTITNLKNYSPPPLPPSYGREGEGGAKEKT